MDKERIVKMRAALEAFRDLLKVPVTRPENKSEVFIGSWVKTFIEEVEKGGNGEQAEAFLVKMTGIFSASSVIPEKSLAPQPQTPLISGALMPSRHVQPGGGMTSQAKIQQFQPSKNGEMGKDYEATIKPWGASALGSIIISDIKGLEEIGLNWDQGRQSIVGQPKKAGEFNLTIRYKIGAGSENAEAPCQLIVNPDPDSLWQNHPSDKIHHFWKEDDDEKTVQGSWFRILAASRRGRSHAHAGSCRDDDFYVDVTGDEKWGILIVADGAGSAKFSRQGSALAVKAAGDKIKETLEAGNGRSLDKIAAEYGDQESSGWNEQIRHVLTSIFGRAINEALLQIQKEVEKSKQSAESAELAEATEKDFSTTLLIAISKYYPKIGKFFLAAFGVGDGGIVRYGQGDSISEAPIFSLTKPDAGEFSGQTRFLDKRLVDNEYAELKKRLNFEFTSWFNGLLAMTDGVSDPKFETEASFKNPKCWASLWQELEPCLRETKPARAILEWLGFRSKGHHDDRTLVLLIPNGIHPSGLESRPSPDQEPETAAQTEQGGVPDSSSLAECSSPLAFKA